MVELHRQIYHDASMGGDDPGLGFEEHLSDVGNKRVWVAEVDAKTVGLVSLIVNGEQAGVEPIVVASTHRGLGIGRELLSCVAEEARRLGVLCLYVRPVARNREAIVFFHQSGFKTLGHVQLFQWLGESSPGQWRKGPEFLGLQFDC